jgi:hypothetical protein
MLQSEPESGTFWAQTQLTRVRFANGIGRKTVRLFLVLFEVLALAA